MTVGFVGFEHSNGGSSSGACRPESELVSKL